MELTQQNNPDANQITAYDEQTIWVNGAAYTQSICFRAQGPISDWPVSNPRDISFEDLLMASGASKLNKSPFEFLNDENGPAVDALTDGPEILLIGTGKKHLLLSEHLLLPFQRSRIGVECMHTQAAARTYNVLVSEGRHVAAALVLD